MVCKINDIIVAPFFSSGRFSYVSFNFDGKTLIFSISTIPNVIPLSVECPAGYFSTGTACVACPKGEYQYEAGKTYCIACPGAETTPGTASRKSDQCGGRVTITSS